MTVEQQQKRIDEIYTLCSDWFFAHDQWRKSLYNQSNEKETWEKAMNEAYEKITEKETKHFLNVAKILDKHLPPDGIIDGEREKLRMRLLFDITNL